MLISTTERSSCLHMGFTIEPQMEDVAPCGFHVDFAPRWVKGVEGLLLCIRAS